MIVTSRVISPQYLIWLLATAAFCLLSRDTSQRRSALLILVSLPITQWIFPYNFTALTHGHLGPVLVLTVRDALLVAAAAIGFIDLWRDTVTGPFLPWRHRSEVPPQTDIQAEPAAVTPPAAPAETPSDRRGQHHFGLEARPSRTGNDVPYRASAGLTRYAARCAPPSPGDRQRGRAR